MLLEGISLAEFTASELLLEALKSMPHLAAFSIALFADQFKS
jgi:hypothetical protein